jgi:hypothetical protein
MERMRHNCRTSARLEKPFGRWPWRKARLRGKEWRTTFDHAGFDIHGVCQVTLFVMCFVLVKQEVVEDSAACTR